MSLRIYNTLTRQKEDFAPLAADRVTMYVCGPTVYKPSHIGHMVGPVIFDTVKRYLTYLGFNVHWVVNITDVDDKLIVRAKELGTTVKDLAEKMTTDYVDCLKKLQVTGITAMPRATETIPEMLDMIQGLIDKGFAYSSHGDVYFNVAKDDDYGKLCNRDPDQLEAGARIEVSERKKNPGDFALWKGSKPGEPAWESPWGPGRPGWHIECSAMSMKLLGKTLDIHGGGLDLQFPHHENELAQSESYNDKPFVKYWMHNGLLKMGQAKMAGSVGNVVNMVDLFQKHPPEVIRFLLLGTHYRSPIEYSDDRLGETRRGLQAFHRFFDRAERITKSRFYDLQAPQTRRPFETDMPGAEYIAEITWLWTRFLEFMDDDFNTGGAIGVVHELLTSLNRFADQRKLEEGQGTPDDLKAFQRGLLVMKEFSQILGIFVQPLSDKKDQGDDNLVQGLMQLIIELRAEARKNKNFAMSDQIRKRLTELKVTLEDRSGGTLWRVE